MFKQPGLVPAFSNPRQRPWYSLAIDEVGLEMPLSGEGFRYLYTVVCYFCGFPVTLCLRTHDPAELAEALVREVFSKFGFCEVMHSDNSGALCNSGAFVSEAMVYVFKRFGVRTSRILPRHPVQNAVCERWHRYLNASLCILLPKYNK